MRSHCENGRQIATSSTTCEWSTRLEVVERAEDAASRCLPRTSGSSSRNPIDAEAELAMALELCGERLAARAGAEHEDEPQVVALPAVPLQHVARSTAR